MYIHKILLDRHLVLYINRVRIVSYIMQYTITRRTCALVFYSFASQEAHQPSGLQSDGKNRLLCHVCEICCCEICCCEICCSHRFHWASEIEVVRSQHAIRWIVM
jgi:hypothetical protein